MTKKTILDALKKEKSILAGKYHVANIGLFGSYARGDFSEKSDIDILVDFSEPIGMEIVDLALDLEKLLNNSVDLVSRKSIKPNMLPFIEEDLINV